jgi:penicillin-binding protein 2
VVCTGALKVGTGVFHCHKKRGHGALDLKHAIMQSCDIYFYEMVRRLGYDHVAPVARTMGLGQKFELPFTTQRYGTVPDSAWKLRRHKEAWTVADSLNASIGQGYVLANPLQLAVMASRIASGKQLQPRLIVNGRAPAAAPLPFSDEHLATIRDAMFGVVNGGGTGGAARLAVPGMSIAAKTGTAQVRRISMAERSHGVINNAALPFKLRDHALFICFGPTENPRYAAGIVLEHGGHTVRNLDSPGIGRDIMTYLLDRPRALSMLAELEPTWGGDITTRMAAEAAAYRHQADLTAAAAAQTETDAGAPTDAPAVENATQAQDAQAAAIANTVPDPPPSQPGPDDEQ